MARRKEKGSWGKKGRNDGGEEWEWQKTTGTGQETLRS